MRITGINYRGYDEGMVVEIHRGEKSLGLHRVTSVGIESCSLQPLRWHERAWHHLCRAVRWLRRTFLNTCASRL